MRHIEDLIAVLSSETAILAEEDAPNLAQSLSLAFPDVWEIPKGFWETVTFSEEE